MPIVLTNGDLITSDAQCIVNTVNCVGVMGKGVALAIRQAFPDVMLDYLSACRSGTLKPGGCLFVAAHGRIIANMATKYDWRKPSQYEWVRDGLDNLAAGLLERGLTSVALPPPGCGNGGLEWDHVYPMIEDVARRMPQIEFRLYAPPGARWQ